MRFLITFLILPFFVFAQNKKITFKDTETNSPIPFIEIQYKDKLFFSDKNGNVIIDFDNSNNTIYVYDLRFIPNVIKIEPTTDAVFLESNVSDLNELLIDKKNITIIKPNTKKIKDFFFVSSELILFTEINFKPEYHNKYLRRLSFKSIPELYRKTSRFLSDDELKKVRKKIKNTTQLLRVNFYDFSKKKVYSSEPVEYKASKSHNFDVYVYDDFLITDKPFFVEIQVIGTLDEDGTFVVDLTNTSIRPQQTRVQNSAYHSRVLKKEEAENIKYIDVVKERSWPESFINFSFELEDK